MNPKAHFAMTISALFFLGLILSKPEVFHDYNKDDRDCRIIKGRMDCASKYTEYKINDVRNQIEYRF